MSIPGSVCCPNAEIPYRISELIKSSDTEIIINCAGRTRSIIGTQALINFGIKNGLNLGVPFPVPKFTDSV